jgi:hypothetical protein
MQPFSSVQSTHMGNGVYLSRALMRHIQDRQMQRAYQTKDRGDFEEAARTRQALNLFDVLMGLVRLGRA